MALQLTPYTVPLLISTLVSAALAVYAFRHVQGTDRDPAVLYFGLLMASITYWCLTYTVQISHTDPATKIQWFRIHELGVSATAVTWLLFALSYTGHESLITKRTTTLFVAAAAPGPLIAAANRLDLLFTIETVTRGSVVLLDFTLTPLSYATISVNYVLVLIGIYFFATTVVNREGTYRGQAAAVLVGAAFPLAANLALVLGVTGPVDYTPIAFSVSGVAFAVAIFRYRLLDLAPVARNRVIESMKDGFVVLDPQGNVIDLNPSARELVDTTGAIGRNVRDVLPKVATTMEDGVQGEVVFDTEEGKRYFQVGVSSITDGDFVGDLVLLRDVTERMEVEKRYRRLIENSSDIIAVLDPDGVFTYLSPSVERIMGYGEDELVGECAFDYVHPDDLDEVTDEFYRGVSEEGYKTKVEYRFRHKDGSWRVLESLGRSLLHDPFVEGIVVNSRDVTRRRRREEDLERTNERLDRFASIVSHDLRNPLSVAKGHLDFAREGDQEALDRVEESHRRMERIIEDVLALARQEESIDPTEVEVSEVARQAWRNVDVRGAEIEIDCDRVVEADPDSLQRAFENLFRNSVEHGSTGSQIRSDNSVEHTAGAASKGSGVVTVRVLETETGFCVEDDGAGIPPEEREAVLEHGYTTSGGGTGLGLSIVRSIVDAHGWNIDVGESDNGGARFDVLTDGKPE